MIQSSRALPQTCPPSFGFTQFVHPSRCSRSLLTTVCFCFCAGVSESASEFSLSCVPRLLHTHVPRVSAFVSGLQPLLTRSIIDVSPSSCSGVWDPWPCRTPILQCGQHYRTENNDWHPSNICANLFLLDTVFVLNLFWHPKVQCIFVFSLMYYFQLIHRMILFLQHSMLSHSESTLQISNGGF